MKIDSATKASGASATDRKLRSLFSRVSHLAGRLEKEIVQADVHRFRTNSRRVETVVTQFTPANGRREKFLRQLSKLRKKAGKLRDLEIQIGILKGLKIPDRQNHRIQLLGTLEREKFKRTKKLAASFDHESVRKMRNRLRKAGAETNLAEVDVLEMAFRLVPHPETSLSEKELHACRIAAKRARYVAELSETPVAGRFVEELKRAQDAIGEWHDSMKLTERARDSFGDVRDSSLVAVLQNITRARFRGATGILTDALRAVAELRQEAMPAHKVAAPIPSSNRSAAA